MDIRTGLSIYNKPWLIQPEAAGHLLDFWERVTNGEVKWDYKASKGENENVESTYSIYQKFFANSSVVVAPGNSWDMSEFKGFNGAEIAVIPVSGPIMKSDYCGSFGTSTLKQLTRMASNTESVKCIIFPFDSPGGTVDGTESFANEIKASGKKTIAFVDGLMCSAAYWVGSSCDEIYAASSTDIIGCIGTMISLKDNSKAMEGKGIISRDYYATESKDKNKAFNEAIAGDGKKLIAELLDPLNDVFLNAVKSNRPNVSEDALTGGDYTSENAMKMGLIDGIKSFEDIVKSEKQPKTTLSIFNSNKMEIKTLAELKANAPEVYTAASQEGAEAERKRINSWLKWKDVDAETVNKGIAEGKPFDMEALSDLSEKKINQNAKKEAESENADPITPSATIVPKKDAEIKAEAAKTDFMALCGIK